MNKNVGALRSHRNALIVGMVFCISIAFVDVLICQLFQPFALSSVAVVSAAVAVSMVAFTVVYGAATLLGLVVFVWLLRLDPVRCALSLAVFAGVFVAFTAAATGQPELPQDSTAWTRTCVHFVLAGLVASATYPATAAFEQRNRVRNLAVTAGLAAPFVLAVTLAYAWLCTHQIDSLASVAGVFLSLGYVVALALAVNLVCLARHMRVIGIALGALGILIALTPLPFWFSRRAVGDSAAYPLSDDHRVKHVILLTVDTLRADVLSCYGEQRIRTPHIDRLAQDGVLFAEAMSPAPWTLPGIASFLTGLSPSVHQATHYESSVPEELSTLAERLRAAGYHTGAIGRNVFLRRRTNLDQGFTCYDVYPKAWPNVFGCALARTLLSGVFPSDASTSELTDLAIDWIRQNHRHDCFLWLHYFDPHLDYEPPAEYLQGTQSTPNVGTTFADLRGIRVGGFVPSQADRARIEELYLAEVRYVDANIGRFLSALEELGLYDDSLIVFTSDHGEEFWEHDGFEHGHTLYREVLEVPLLVKCPSNRWSGVVSRVVTTESVLPTILGLCGVECDAECLSGRSLQPLWMPEAQPVQQQPAISTGLLHYEDRVSVVCDRFKYIRWLVTGREELYDLKTDPDEQQCVVASFPDELNKARDALARHDEQAEKLRAHWGVTTPEESGVDAESLQRLRSLGYVE